MPETLVYANFEKPRYFMVKNRFLKHSIGDLCRPTSIARVTDEECWSLLVTPSVKNLLGPVLSGQMKIMETVEGLFPGDEVVNLADHRLYGGQKGYVRFPYLHSFYETANGAFVIKRDGTTVQVFCWYGDVHSGCAMIMLETGLRDRRYDATRWAHDSALNPYPIDDPAASPRVTPWAKSVELLVFGFLPGTGILQSTGDEEFERFVKNPFTFLNRTDVFLEYLDKVRRTNRSPGQYCQPIADVSKLILPGLEQIAQRRHYDFIEACPSHYHVAKWFEKTGFHYTLAAQRDTLQAFSDGIARIKASGAELTHSEESWLCVAQSLPEALIPKQWNLFGPVWPQDLLHQNYLWMHKPLSKRAVRHIRHQLNLNQ